MSDETMSMLDDRIAELEDEVAALQRENAALRADKERLDWLARNRRISATERPWSVTPQSLRESIDAARKEDQP
jgi:predicted  nucleic acid-binding Zn-ribbon protein